MATNTELSQPTPRQAVAAPRRGLSRDAVENRLFAVLRWVVIAGLLVITVFPF